MAKMKFKLDLKGLLIAHGEKLVAALVAVLVLMVVWSGLGREQISADHDPEALMKKAEVAKTNITSTGWNQFTQRPELKDYSNRSIMDQIALEPYVGTRTYDNPVFQFKVRRGDPILLSVGELEGHAGFGGFSVVNEKKAADRLENNSTDFIKPQPASDSGGGHGLREYRPQAGYRLVDTDQLKGIRFAVVTGLVPVAEQQDQYNAVFQSAIGYDPQNDVPHYLGYIVERRDVAADGSGSEWAVKMVFQPSTLIQQAAYWSGSMAEVVLDKFTHDRLTYPLGPLVLKSWGREVAHSRIPLGARNVQDAAAPEPKRGQPEPDHEADDDFNKPKPRPKAVPKQEEKKPEVTDMKLLRYFDFDVEPGKQYQYRFRLVLRDPNMVRDKVAATTSGAPPAAADATQGPALPNSMLKQEVIDRIKDPKNKKNMRFTDWSEPSPVISIPYDNRLLVGAVEYPTRTSEPLVTIMVKSFDIEEGTEIVGEEKFARGSVVRFKRDVTLLDPKSGKSRTIEAYDFDPQAIVLDIRCGGAVLPKGKSFAEPVEVLIQDQTGRLVVHRELADELEMKESRDTAPKAVEEPVPGGGLLGGAAPAPKEGNVDAAGLLDGGTPKKGVRNRKSE